MSNQLLINGTSLTLTPSTVKVQQPVAVSLTTVSLGLSAITAALSWVPIGVPADKNTSLGTPGAGIVYGTGMQGCIYGSDHSNNNYGINHYANTYGSDHYNNVYGPNTVYCTFGAGHSFNTYGSNFGSNVLGSEVRHCTFGDSIQFIVVRDNCNYLQVGNNCKRVQIYNCNGVPGAPFVIPAGTVDATYINNVKQAPTFVNLAKYGDLLTLIKSKALFPGTSYRWPYFWGRAESVLVDKTQTYGARVEKVLLYDSSIHDISAFNCVPEFIPPADVEYIVQQAISTSSMQTTGRSEKYVDDVVSFDHVNFKTTSTNYYAECYDPAKFTLYQGQQRIDMIFDAASYYARTGTYADLFTNPKMVITIYGDNNIRLIVPFQIIDATAGTIRVAVDAFTLYADPQNNFYADMSTPGILIGATVTNRALPGHAIDCSFDFRNSRTTVYEWSIAPANTLFIAFGNPSYGLQNATRNGNEYYYLPFGVTQIARNNAERTSAESIMIKGTHPDPSIVLATSPNLYQSIHDIKISGIGRMICGSAYRVRINNLYSINMVGPTNPVIGDFSADQVNQLETNGSITNTQFASIGYMTVGVDAANQGFTITGSAFLAEVNNCSIRGNISGATFVTRLGFQKGYFSDSAYLGEITDSIISGTTGFLSVSNRTTLGPIYTYGQSPYMGLYLAAGQAAVVGEFRTNQGLSASQPVNRINTTCTLDKIIVAPEPGITMALTIVVSPPIEGSIVGPAAATLTMNGLLGHYVKLQKYRVITNAATPTVFSNYWRVTEAFTA